MGLEQETERRLRQLLRGRTCCRCEQPAVRFARNRFYCDRHFPYGRPDGGPGKAYKHPKP
jgi:hypothetical protein